MIEISYVGKRQKITLAATGGMGSTQLVELTNVRVPFEELILWVQAAAAGNYSAAITLNETALSGTGNTLTAVTDAVPHNLQYSGIFPPNAPDELGGIIPGLQITNNGSSPLVVYVSVLALSQGDFSGT